VRIEDTVRSLGHSDVVHSIGKVVEVLGGKSVSPTTYLGARLEMLVLTVSSNLEPSPVDRGHIRSNKKATLNKFTLFWSTYVSIPALLMN
jgi:hypothetical protein